VDGTLNLLLLYGFLARTQTASASSKVQFLLGRSKRMRWAGHVARMGRMLLDKVFVRKINGRDNKEDIRINKRTVSKWASSPYIRPSRPRGREVQLYSFFNLDAG
jgi:hypothetical protein